MNYWLLGITLFIVIFLIILEYIDHDCIRGKKCCLRVDPPNREDDPLLTIEKVTDMLRGVYSYSTWRQAFIVSLLSAMCILLFIKRTLNNVTEFILITGIIFIAVYFSYSWIWTHYVYPNSIKIEESLRVLGRKI